MSLKYALLGMLSIRPMSGYDIKKFFDQSVGLIWNATHSQIYVQLDQMEGEGLVEKRSIIQEGRPNKNLYRATDKGFRELQQWLAEPIRAPDYKDEFMLRFFFSDFLDREILKDHLKKAQGLMTDRMQSLEKVTNRKVPPMSNITLHAARMGQRYYQMYLDWLEESLCLVESGQL
ncbi:MAG TPA: PadR family transcriptional regulator [Dehalococcoidia bacterium]|nr:PadR family transcriptional regulator [Dehalococcoidia bacterium]